MWIELGILDHWPFAYLSVGRTVKSTTYFFFNTVLPAWPETKVNYLHSRAGLECNSRSQTNNNYGVSHSNPFLIISPKTLFRERFGPSFDKGTLAERLAPTQITNVEETWISLFLTARIIVTLLMFAFGFFSYQRGGIFAWLVVMLDAVLRLKALPWKAKSDLLQQLSRTQIWNCR